MDISPWISPRIFSFTSSRIQLLNSTVGGLSGELCSQMILIAINHIPFDGRYPAVEIQNIWKSVSVSIHRVYMIPIPQIVQEFFHQLYLCKQPCN